MGRCECILHIIIVTDLGESKPGNLKAFNCFKLGTAHPHGLRIYCTNDMTDSPKENLKYHRIIHSSLAIGLGQFCRKYNIANILVGNG